MAHSDCIDRIADGRQSAIDKKDKVLESANVSMVVSSLIVSTAAQKVQCMSNQADEIRTTLISSVEHLCWCR